MTLIIKDKISDEDLKKAINKMIANKKSKSLKKFFGTAVEKIDGVEFQRKLRDEWN